jgi:hypothetical protein
VDVDELTRSFGDVTVRPLARGEEGALNDAFNGVFNQQRSLEEWAWKFPPEPDGRAIRVAECGGEIVAHYAGVPARVQVDGRVWSAVQIVDVFSTRAARAALFGRRGVWVRTVDAFIEDIGFSGRAPLFYGFPSARARRLGTLELGYYTVEPPLEELNRPVAARRRGLRSWVYRAEPSADWEPRLDLLWDRVRRDYPVAVVRDAEYALRRYAGHPGVRYHRFVILPRVGRRVLAWVVFRTDGGVCRLVDLLWDRGHPGALEMVSWLSSRLAGDTGCSTETAWLHGDREGSARLQARGWVVSPQRDGLSFVCRSFDADLDVHAFDHRVYVTLGDSDLV